MNLMSLIGVATELKPEFGDPCNNCGWCCLTEVCQMGEYYGATQVLPCSFLVSKGDVHQCGLILDGTMRKEVIGIGTGCDAKTQTEQLLELGKAYDF